MGTHLTHFLDSLGWAVLHASWQGVVALIAVIVMRGLVSERAPALRYAVQFSALILCLIAFFWTFAHYLGQAFMPPLEETVAGGATLAAIPPADAVTTITLSFSPNVWLAHSGVSLSTVTPYLACLWVVGFAVMSLRYGVSFVHVQSLRIQGVTMPNADWQARFAQLLRQCGAAQNARLLISDRIKGPVTFGLFKPVVLVPVGFLSRLPADQVEAILLHELAHIRRYDYALNLLQTAVKTMLFFHPAVHIIARWADQDREQACDDIAIGHGRDPLSLVRGLAALRVQSDGPLMMAATGDGTDTPLMTRLTRLVEQSPARGRPEYMMMSVLSLLLIGTVYLGSTSQASARPTPPAPPLIAPPVMAIDGAAIDGTVMDAIAASPAAPLAPARSEPPAPQEMIVTPNRTAPPAPPAMPALPPLSASTIQSERDFQDFIMRDIEQSETLAAARQDYEQKLTRYIETNVLSEAETEALLSDFEDFNDSVDDIFDDRRDAAEDLYEDYVEAQQDRHDANDADINAAHAIGIASAIKGIEAAERAIANRPRTQATAAVIDAERKALANARKDLIKAQKQVNHQHHSHALSTSIKNTVEAQVKAEVSRANAAVEREIKMTVRRAKHQARAQASAQAIAEAKADAKAVRKQAALSRKHAEQARKNAKAHAKSDHSDYNRYEAFRKQVMAELLKDGMIKDASETVYLSHPNNVMSLNGKPFPRSIRGKYCAMMDSHGMIDNRTEVTFTPDKIDILTDWKNGKHTHRISYTTSPYAPSQ